MLICFPISLEISALSDHAAPPAPTPGFRSRPAGSPPHSHSYDSSHRAPPALPALKKSDPLALTALCTPHSSCFPDCVNKNSIESVPVSLSPSVRNRRSDLHRPDTIRMSAPDAVSELVEALRRAFINAPAAAPPAATSASTATSPSPPVIASPVATPAPFSGSVEDCNGFLLQCSLALEMQPHLYPDDWAKVAFIISRLDGKALRWAEPIWTHNSPIVTSLPSFIEHFKEVFGKPAWDSSVGERLCRLKQGVMSVSDYALQFRTLAAASGWNEQALITTYRQGLDPRIRLHLAAYEDSIELEKFIQLSIRFATRMQLCLEEHQDQPLFPATLRRPEPVSHPEPASEPMHLEHSDLATTERQREWQRRLTQNRCFYCGRSGHYVAECPIRPARSMPMRSSILGQRGTSSPVPSAASSTSKLLPHRRSTRKASKLPPHRPWDCAIDLIPGEPVPKGRIYSLSIPEEKALEEYIKEALSQGYIRPSTSPAASSFFFVAKKDGGLRPCIDYQALNKITVKFRYPLPLVPLALERLRGATVFTKLDLCSTYNLIRIREGDEWKTAFVTSTGHYEYLVMPYGLVNAPSVFQDFMHEVLREFLHRLVLVYIDILIYSRSMAEHLRHVGEVLQRLRDYHLFLKAENSITSPLTSLLRNKPKSLTWNPAATQAFTKLKTAFTTAPLLAHPNPELPFIVEVNASTTGVGAVLSQQQGNPRKLHPCAFFSRKLSPAEVNYDIGNRELLTIKLALEQWRHWLEGAKHPFVVLTDHNNLEYLRAAKRLNPRQARWALFFTRFHFTISYHPGSKNIKADALSRIHSRDETSEEPESILPEKLFVSPISWSEEMLPEPSAPSGAPSGCPQGLQFIPHAQRTALIHSTHASLGTGHPGINGTLSLLTLHSGG
ncbi:hypothetical protein QTP70_023701 [Hemibagrus guttatus]|uniref:ribonuclease H n=1 Tax=Hemibagrus guttatus TaxID=175788 RepID=A0AAE0UTA4_9TELE|nr:hypothetical protein QTP70_023701 [Hemibagrus guttatus]